MALGISMPALSFCAASCVIQVLGFAEMGIWLMREDGGVGGGKVFSQVSARYFKG